MTPEIPSDCRRVLRAISSQPHTWWSIYALQRALPEHTGETIARKCRKLKKIKVLDWCRPPDRNTGGRFIEYRLAAPGSGCEHDHETRRPILGDPTPPRSGETVAADEADLLFKLPPPDRHFTERTGRATR